MDGFACEWISRIFFQGHYSTYPLSWCSLFLRLYLTGDEQREKVAVLNA